MAASSAPNRREAEISAVRDSLLLIFEQCLQAQLSVVRRLRAGKAPPETDATAAPRRKRGRSQVDLAEDILKSARTPLHVTEIITRIEKTTGVHVDSESLVSALSKRVARKD